MKPALPAVVKLMPTCCMVEAANSAAPQQRPPSQSTLPARRFSAAVRAGCGPRRRSSRAMTGSSVSAPSSVRTALKVNGPTSSLPTLWATKDAPQIRAVRVSIRLPRSFFRSTV